MDRYDKKISTDKLKTKMNLGEKWQEKEIIAFFEGIIFFSILS